MKNFFKIFTILFAAFVVAGCFKTQKYGPDEEPYNRSKRANYERKIRYSVMAPFMYEGTFYAYYALGKKISNADRKGFYEVEFTNGPKKGEVIKTKDVILKTVAASASDLKRGMAVVVNHWDPKVHDENSRIDMWRKGVVYNLDKLGDGLVMLEFPHDKNDFMATKETYRLDSIRLIVNPQVRDPRIFLD